MGVSGNDFLACETCGKVVHKACGRYVADRFVCAAHVKEAQAAASLHVDPSASRANKRRWDEFVDFILDRMCSSDKKDGV
jgi:hypothetical protein